MPIKPAEGEDRACAIAACRAENETLIENDIEAAAAAMGNLGLDVGVPQRFIFQARDANGMPAEKEVPLESAWSDPDVVVFVRVPGAQVLTVAGTPDEQAAVLDVFRNVPPNTVLVGSTKMQCVWVEDPDTVPVTARALAAVCKTLAAKGYPTSHQEIDRVYLPGRRHANSYAQELFAVGPIARGSLSRALLAAVELSPFGIVPGAQVAPSAISITPAKLAVVLDRLREQTGVLTTIAVGWTSRCPWRGHGMRKESPELTVTYRDDESVTVHCGCGCRAPIVFAALGLRACDYQTEVAREFLIDEADYVKATDFAGALLACSGRRDVYVRGSRLVRIVLSELPGGAPSIRPLVSAGLMELLSRVVRWNKTVYDKKGNARVMPTKPERDVVQAFAAHGTWPGIPTLLGIVETPVFLKDGTLCATPGYDPASKLYYHASCEVPSVQMHPSDEEVRRALELILDVVSDFPFATDASRSAFIATLLTAFVRFAFNGPVPLTLFGANTRGAGKSKLADITTVLHTGRDAPRATFSDDEAEMRKTITTHVLRGTRFILLDNVKAGLGGAALDAVLTGTTWDDRILGGNTSTEEAPLLAQWFATGNNTTLHGDTGRRTLIVSLRTDYENPEDRSDFKYPNLLEHVKANRPVLVAACLTILRGYYAAGAPKAHISPWGSFEGWDLLRHVMVWLGMPDPKETQVELRDRHDEDGNALRAFTDELYKLTQDGPLTAKEIIHASSDSHPYRQGGVLELPGGRIVKYLPGFSHEALAEAIEVLVPVKYGTKNIARPLGMALGRFEKRVTIVSGTPMAIEVVKMGNRNGFRVVALTPKTTA